MTKVAPQAAASKSAFDLDMDSEFAERLNEIVEREVERAREIYTQTATRRMQELSEDFGKKIEMLRKEMFSYNAEITTVVDIVKQD